MLILVIHRCPLGDEQKLPQVLLIYLVQLLSLLAMLLVILLAILGVGGIDYSS